MTYTPIPAGTIDWDEPLNAALASQDARITANEDDIAALEAAQDDLVYLVDNHGAVGNGTSDDQPVIQALINSVPLGATVQLGPKRYGLGSALTLPPYVTLSGPMLDRDAISADNFPSLKPLAGFSSTSVINMISQTAGGYSTETRNIRLQNLNVDGDNLTSEVVVGILATGFVHGTQLYNISVQAMTSHAIQLLSDGSEHPYSWYMSNVQLKDTGSSTSTHGFNLIGTDHTLVSCRALGVSGNGFQLSNGANTRLNNCQSEWSGNHGYYITGSWGTGQGSGGLIMSGCSTDRNSQHGILIDSTGNASHLLSGLMLRRDGRNGFPGTGGGSLAGLRISAATTPVVVSGITVYPGVGDDGLGVNSPQFGTSVANSTYVSINDGYIHADATAWNDGGGNTALYRGPLVGTATGTTAAPTRSLVGANSMPGPLTLTQGGYQVTRGASTNTALAAMVVGDSVNRLLINANGQLAFSSGAGASDVQLERLSANNLNVINGNLAVNTAGRGLRVAEGSNAKAGVATLVAGTVTVANTSITANSRIQLTSQVDGGTPGFLRVSARTVGTNFTITSSNAADTSTVAYLIIEP